MNVYLLLLEVVAVRQMADMLSSLSRDQSKLAQALLAPADLQNIIEKEVESAIRRDVDEDVTAPERDFFSTDSGMLGWFPKFNCCSKLIILAANDFRWLPR